MDNLCPQLTRQRLSIEAKVEGYRMGVAQVRVFAKLLTEAIGMSMIDGIEPIVWTPDTGKHAGVTFVQPWVESALQIHTWSEFDFIAIDIFTCKPFNTQEVVDLVFGFFHADEVQWADGPCTFPS